MSKIINLLESGYVLKGTIEESGSNSNGSYVKFADGTMICYGTNNGVNNSYRLITFPIEFNSVPKVLVSISAYADNYVLETQPYDITTASFKVVVLYLYISSNTWAKGANYFNWLAIGKWK